MKSLFTIASAGLLGNLHLSEAGLHATPFDDSCRSPDDRSC
jgi:hypothetical protein